MLTDTEIGRRENGRLVLRRGTLRVRWNLAEAVSGDGYNLRALFSCAARALEDLNERKMLEEAFFARSPVLNDAAIATYFAPRLESTLRQATSGLPIETLMSDSGKADLSKKLVEAAKAVAFSCGLEIAGPFDLELDSPALRRRQEEQRQSAENAQRLSQASALFKQFQEIRQSAPELNASQVLSRIGTQDQAQLLRTLLLASAQQSDAKTLWAAAGQSLVKIEPSPDEGATPRTSIIELPATLGPLRSVQRADLDGHAVLLVGARAGVWIVDPKKPDKALACLDPGIDSQLGFNAAILRDHRLWATHGQAGVVCWEISQPGAPISTIRPGQGVPTDFAPRSLVSLDDDRLCVSSGQTLWVFNDKAPPRELSDGPTSPILAVIAQRDLLLVVHEDGEICSRDLESLSARCAVRRSGKLCAAGALPWLGSTRLLLASEEGPVYCVGIDDELVTQYASPHRGLRQITAAADRVVGISADRQRLVFWNSWDGRQSTGELHISGLTRHRVADVEFA